MHLTGGGPIKHIQQLDYIGVVGVSLEDISSTVEAQDEAFRNYRFAVNVFAVWMIIMRGAIRHWRHSVCLSNRDGGQPFAGQPKQEAPLKRWTCPPVEPLSCLGSRLDDRTHSHEELEQVSY